jgi:hypothetical protein
VPKEIVRDHSDIFNENALAMIARIFRMSNPDVAKPGITTTVAPRTMRLGDSDGKMPPPRSGNKRRRSKVRRLVWARQIKMTVTAESPQSRHKIHKSCDANGA